MLEWMSQSLIPKLSELTDAATREGVRVRFDFEPYLKATEKAREQAAQQRRWQEQRRCRAQRPRAAAPAPQNHGIHQMYMSPRLRLLAASAMSRSAWPSGDSGKLGAASTPTTTPERRLWMFSRA